MCNGKMALRAVFLFPFLTILVCTQFLRAANMFVNKALDFWQIETDDPSLGF